MDLAATLAALAASLVIAGVAGWLGARPPDLRRGPRMVPYRMIMLLSGAAGLLFLVHLVNLAGVHTGR